MPCFANRSHFYSCVLVTRGSWIDIEAYASDTPTRRVIMQSDGSASRTRTADGAASSAERTTSGTSAVGAVPPPPAKRARTHEKFEQCAVASTEGHDDEGAVPISSAAVVVKNMLSLHTREAQDSEGGDATARVRDGRAHATATASDASVCASPASL